MRRIETTVRYNVSDYGYCNLRQEKHRGFPADQRCRFCTNLGKDGFVCVLHNEPLSVEEGSLINKAEQCLVNMVYKSKEVPDEEHSSVTPRELVKAALVEYNKEYKRLRAEGYPDVLAMKVAQENVLR